jgi:hypothetical protein
MFGHTISQGSALFDDAQRYPESLVDRALLLPIENFSREAMADLVAKPQRRLAPHLRQHASALWAGERRGIGDRA